MPGANTREKFIRHTQHGRAFSLPLISGGQVLRRACSQADTEPYSRFGQSISRFGQFTRSSTHGAALAERFQAGMFSAMLALPSLAPCHL
jgi:hypothetical protein